MAPAVSNKQVVKGFYDDVFNRHDADAVRKYFDSSVVMEESGSMEPVRGIEANIQLVRSYLTAFPDVTVKVMEQVEEGDLVMSRLQFTGTHKGTFVGVAPTQKKFSIEGMQLDRIKDGKTVTSKLIWDVAGMMLQLGITPQQMQRQQPGAGARPQA